MKKESFITKLSTLPINEDFLQKQEVLNPIEGWFSPASHGLFSFFLSYQNDIKVNGNLGEIGVWKGKSASVICNYAKNNENIFLIDPLIQNFSETINRNIDKICNKIPSKLLLCNMKSDDFVKIPNYQTLLDSFRFFHIDGCHSGKNIYCDLKIVDSLLTSDGIVVVDDFFNYSYPQITEAVYKYLQLNPYSYRLFCMGFNKAYLCRPDFFNKYYSYTLKNIQSDFMKKQMIICVKKTSGIGDSYTITVDGYEKDDDPITGYRGPDWEQNKLDFIETK